MLREKANLFSHISIIIDVLLILGAFFSAYIIRGNMPGGLKHLQNYVWILLPVLPVWYLLIQKCRLYASLRRLSFFDIWARVFTVHLSGGVVVAAAIFFLDRDQYSRGLFVIFLGVSFIFLSVGKMTARAILGVLRKRGYNTRHLLIVGTQKKAKRFLALVREHADWGLTVRGFVQVQTGPLLETLDHYPVLGHVEQLIEICKREQVDEVVFCIPKDYVVDAELYLQQLEELGVTVRMVLEFFDSSLYRKEISVFHDELPVLTFYAKTFDETQLLLKRILDILGATVGLFLTGLMLPYVAILVKRESPGPLFFGQERVGENGRVFKCWKFRSMHVDAEERKQELMAQNEMNGAIFKIKNDPRVTRFGRFLRKTSLDEFPQFWNVLKGEMSLVGTRPPTLEEVQQYENWQRRRISIKPGITGLWQVSGRNSIEDFDKIVGLDLQYIDNWSLFLDLKILFRTLKVVVLREGSS